MRRAKALVIAAGVVLACAPASRVDEPNTRTMPSPFVVSSAEVGTWGPDLGNVPRELEWDVTGRATAGKTLHVLFDYVAGRSALSIEWAAVLADGVEAIRDDHFGWTGTDDIRNAYAFAIPAGLSPKKWTLRARVRAEGGHTTAGRVLALEAPPPPPARVPGHPEFAKTDIPGAAYYEHYNKGAVLVAHRAFAEGLYDDAARLYEEANAGGPPGGMLYDIQEVVKKRKELGEIQPEVVHDLCVVWVTERRIKHPDRVEVVRDVLPEMKARWLLHELGVMKRLAETYSEGRLSLSFSTGDVWAEHDATDRFAYLASEKIENGDYVLENIDRCDTIAVSSTTASPGLGGLAMHSYLRGVFTAPQRGGIQFNAKEHDAALLFHELFHVFEQAAPTGVPGHAFETADRALVPGWKGEGEFDYYQWHYTNTFPKTGWKRFEMTSRNPGPMSKDLEALRRVRALYDAIPIAERKARHEKATKLARSADKTPDDTAALALLNQALEQSPANIEALSRHVKRSNDPVLRKRLEDVRTFQLP